MCSFEHIGGNEVKLPPTVLMISHHCQNTSISSVLISVHILAVAYYQVAPPKVYHWALRARSKELSKGWEIPGRRVKINLQLIQLVPSLSLSLSIHSLSKFLKSPLYISFVSSQLCLRPLFPFIQQDPSSFLRTPADAASLCHSSPANTKTIRACHRSLTPHQKPKLCHFFFNNSFNISWVENHPKAIKIDCNISGLLQHIGSRLFF